MATITEVLNIWNELGIFSYIIPFLLVFSIIFALLQKTKVLGENKAIEVIISVSIGLLSIQFDIVPTFFANIFPKFAVGLAIFLVLVVMLGFFYEPKGDKGLPFKWVGWLIGIGVVIWAITSWGVWIDNYSGFWVWFKDYFWSLAIFGGLIALIVWAVNDKKGTPAGK